MCSRYQLQLIYLCVGGIALEKKALEIAGILGFILLRNWIAPIAAARELKNHRVLTQTLYKQQIKLLRNDSSSDRLHLLRSL
jgi:hypothetical protein